MKRQYGENVKITDKALGELEAAKNKPEPTDFTKATREEVKRILHEAVGDDLTERHLCDLAISACEHLESQAEQIKELSAQARNASLYADERNELREQLAATNKEIEQQQDQFTDYCHTAHETIGKLHAEIERLKKLYRELEIKSDAIGVELERIQKLMRALKGDK